ncbi:MAG: WXG100 family type VII secretion target [Dermatophilaceae bacterium]
MALGGNPERIRDQARRLRSEAGEVEYTGSGVRQGEGVQWVGVAAERYRERLRDHSREIDGVRDAVEVAARRLDELADALEERQREIAQATRVVEDRLSAAKDTIGRFVGAVWDELSDLERDAERAARDVVESLAQLPAPGHPQWLLLAQGSGR